MFLVSPENDVSLLSHFPKLLGRTVSDSGIAEFLLANVRLQFQRPWVPDPSVGRVWLLHGQQPRQAFRWAAAGRKPIVVCEAEAERAPS